MVVLPLPTPGAWAVYRRPWARTWIAWHLADPRECRVVEAKDQAQLTDLMVKVELELRQALAAHTLAWQVPALPGEPAGHNPAVPGSNPTAGSARRGRDLPAISPGTAGTTHAARHRRTLEDRPDHL